MVGITLRKDWRGVLVFRKLAAIILLFMVLVTPQAAEANSFPAGNQINWLIFGVYAIALVVILLTEMDMVRRFSPKAISENQSFLLTMGAYLVTKLAQAGAIVIYNKAVPSENGLLGYPILYGVLSYAIAFAWYGYFLNLSDQRRLHRLVLAIHAVAFTPPLLLLLLGLAMISH